MQFGELPTEQAAGHILAHKLFDQSGKRLFNKGRNLTPSDVDMLIAHGVHTIVVAQLEQGELDENEGAQRIGEALAGAYIKVTASGVGRANLISEVAGPIRVNVSLLSRINNVDEGITIATLPTHTLATTNKLVTLVKIIPFGVSKARVDDVLAMVQEAGPVVSVRPLQSKTVALIVTGPQALQAKLTSQFKEPVRERITALGSQLTQIVSCEHQIDAIAATIKELSQKPYDLIAIAGYSAIMDRADVAPTALQLAGGNVAHFGVPVDPGSLMMLGYLDAVPVLGLPGCVKSPKFSVIDMLLPRLLSGERLTRADLVVLGHGGLLPDIKQRPRPRSTD